MLYPQYEGEDYNEPQYPEQPQFQYPQYNESPQYQNQGEQGQGKGIPHVHGPECSGAPAPPAQPAAAAKTLSLGLDYSQSGFESLNAGLCLVPSAAVGVHSLGVPAVEEFQFKPTRKQKALAQA